MSLSPSERVAALAAESAPRTRKREILIVLLAYVGITLWFWWPMVQDPEAVWSVGRDYFQNAWNLWWVDHAVEQGLPIGQTDRLFHPQGTSLAFHTLSPATTGPGWVLMNFFGMSIGATYTWLFLAAFPLSGIGAWLLARHLSGSSAAAFVAGVFFAFNPYHTAMVTQLNNVQFQWLPLAILGVIFIIEGGGWRAMLLAGVATALCGYVDWYQPVFVVLAALILVPSGLLRERRLGDMSTWMRLVGAGILAILLMLPGLMPMIELLRAGDGPSGLDSPIRYAGEVQLFGMRPKGTVGHVFWPVILGWTTLLAVAAILFKARKSVAPGWWVLAIVAFVLMQGARLTILSHETSIPLPMAVFERMPGLAFIRVPHRFLLLLLLAIVGILARGLVRAENRLGPGLIYGFGLLMAAEMQPAPLQSVQLNMPPVYDEMSRQADDFAVLELPLDFRDGYSMYLQTVHGKALTGGYTSHLLPGALMPMHSEVIRALLPASNDSDVLGLPEHLAVDVNRLDRQTLNRWRKELILDHEVRFIVLRERTDFTPGVGLEPPQTTAEKLRYGLTPFRFNPVLNDLQAVARSRVADFRAHLVTESVQAVALVEKMFGPADTSLGSARVKVWDLRAVREQLLPETEIGR